MRTTFLLIRHGLTDAVDRVLTGRAPDVHLNATGRSQAKHLADELRHIRLAAIISSPLGARARDRRANCRRVRLPNRAQRRLD